MAAERVSAGRLLTRAQSAIRQGDRAGAARLYRKVLDQFPANRRARKGLAALAAPITALPVTQAEIDAAMALYSAGEVRAALKRAEALSARDPALRAPCDIRAACHRALGAPDKALPIYRDLLERFPEDARVWRNCGLVLNDLLTLDEAVSCLEMATRLDPEDLQGWLALGRARLTRGHPRPAFDAAAQALARDDGHPGALNLLGQCLRDLGQALSARQAHQRALERAETGTDRATAHNGLGVLAGALGEVDEAEMQYRAATRLMPRNMQAHLNLSRQHRYTADSAHLATLRTLLNRQDEMTVLDRAHLHFALFNALDQVDPGSDAGFAHLAEGNALRRIQLRHSPGGSAALLARADALADTAPRNDAMPAGPTPRPIFVVGMPRSGTTLTERILAGAPGVHGAGELPVVETVMLALLRQLQADGREDVTAGDLARLATEIRNGIALYAPDAPVIIDKMPLNFRWAGLLLAALPEARIVHIRRDPMETCWSNFRTCYAGLGDGFAYGQSDLAQFYHHYTDHMAAVAQRSPQRITTVDYEDIVTRTEGTARHLIANCDLAWSDACLHPEANAAPVLTASASQARTPVYNGNRGRWRLYATHLTALREGLRTPRLSPQPKQPAA